MKFYNTLSKKIEEFIPYEKGIVRMYTCGPTVYHYAHIGNMRTYIIEDLLEKSLKYLGYDVKRVMNITDVGHLQSDGDVGEDKMSIAAKRERKTSKEIAEFYTNEFFQDCKLVNVTKPKIVAKATEHIDEYIKIISKLLEKNFAYISNGNVYFDTEKFANYYELSGRKADELLIAVRDGIEKDIDKKNPFDFGLWFTNSKFTNPELIWDSPWGVGYPGWHIECSGISLKYLGEHLDIHCGAEDAVFPHHSNEIAQSEAYLGHKWCNYWLHLSFLNIKNVKMSKSKGDIIRVKTLKEKGYDPLAFRFLILNSYYHKQLEFSFELLDEAANQYKKLKKKIQDIQADDLIDENQYIIYDDKFKYEIGNDLNFSNAIALIHKLIKDNKVSNSTKIRLIDNWDCVLGLDLFKKEEKKIENEAYILEMIEKRNKAKKEKDFVKADEIRDNLLKQNIVLIDTKEGTKFEVK